MNRKLVAAVAVILFIVIVLAVIAGTFLATAPTNEITYKEPASAVRASLGKTATSDTIVLRLNGITDGSDPATRAAWSQLNLASGLYNVSLTPSPGDRYLIANVTVTNAQPTSVPFSYAAFVLLTPNNTAYYANYAVCSSGCSAQALKNQTLNAGFTSDLYALFSVPAGTNAQKVVYTTSNPVIVLSTA
ncbi:MAG: DUF4352 domain-containing protein [Halobacteriota archaeon]